MVRYAAALAGVLLATPAAAQITLAPGETLLEIQAVGEASAPADVAMISMGVVSTGSTAREATDANAAQMAAVVAALRRAGVEARFIQTLQINLQPRFAHMDASDYQGQAKITGYVAQNSVSVTLTRLSIAADVIAAGFAAGANSVNGPTLGLRDGATALAAARRDAIAKARSEAEAYADGLGLKLARILRVSERGAYATTDSYPREIHVTGAMQRAGLPAAPLSGGEMREQATVWIDYALIPK
jgi:uncharacterized protein YggE